jgi:antitoxin (DNA-binding transcriptional repressor) of toxin-antitoxin stability system
MIKVSIRELQRNASMILKELPVLITKYNVPIAKIECYDTSSVTMSVTSTSVASEQARAKVKKSVMQLGEREISRPEIEPASMASLGWCEGHFEKDKTYPRRMISYEDFNGNLVVNKKMLCPMCVSKLEDRVKNEGGKIL